MCFLGLHATWWLELVYSGNDYVFKVQNYVMYFPWINHIEFSLIHGQGSSVRNIVQV